MIRRKRNLIFAQIILFILGVFIIVYTYYNESQIEQITPTNRSKRTKRNTHDVGWKTTVGWKTRRQVAGDKTPLCVWVPSHLGVGRKGRRANIYGAAGVALLWGCPQLLS